MSHRFVLAFVLLTAGCGAYRGEYAQPLMVQSRAVGLECLDVRVTRRAGHDVRLVYEVGNRCLSPVDVDLSAVSVSGTHGMAMNELLADDPRHELRAARLDGHGSLREVIAYESPDWAPERVCVVLAGLTEGAPAEPICLGEERI